MVSELFKRRMQRLESCTNDALVIEVHNGLLAGEPGYTQTFTYQGQTLKLVCLEAGT